MVFSCEASRVRPKLNYFLNNCRQFCDDHMQRYLRQVRTSSPFPFISEFGDFNAISIFRRGLAKYIPPSHSNL